MPLIEENSASSPESPQEELKCQEDDHVAQHIGFSFFLLCALSLALWYKKIPSLDKRRGDPFGR